MPTSHSSIESHPQKQRVIDGIIAGESLRSIAATLDPSVSYKAVQRYANRVIHPTLNRAVEITAAVQQAMRPAPSQPPSQDMSRDASQGVTPFKPLSQSSQTHTNKDVTGEIITAASVTSAMLSVDPITSVGSAPAVIESRAGRVKMLAERQALLHNAALSELAMPGDDLRKAPKYLGTLLTEVREHEKQAAQELGQWQEGTGTQIAIQIVVPAADGHHVDPRQAEATIIDITPR